MNKTLRTTLNLAMAWLLSLGLLVPATALPKSPAPATPEEGCPFCVEIEEDLSCCEDSCCEPEESEVPEPPCDGNDCQCPDCPGPAPSPVPLSAILFSGSHSGLPGGHFVFSPAIGPEAKPWDDSPSPPPPRVA